MPKIHDIDIRRIYEPRSEDESNRTGEFSVTLVFISEQISPVRLQCVESEEDCSCPSTQINLFPNDMLWMSVEIEWFDRSNIESTKMYPLKLYDEYTCL